MENFIIKDLGSNEYIIRCGFCQGKGRRPQKTEKWKIVQDGTYSCNICSGRGLMRVRTDDLIVPDAQCNGTGWKGPTSEYSSSETCYGCNGTGARSLSGKLVVVP